LPAVACRLIALLDQQPLLLVTTARQPGAHQGPGAGQFLTDQGEFQFAVPVVLYRVAVGLPDAMVPDNHITPAVLPLGDTALEAAIAQRVILDMHRQALVGRVQARSLGHGPAD